MSSSHPQSLQELAPEYICIHDVQEEQVVMRVIFVPVDMTFDMSGLKAKLERSHTEQ